MVKIRLMGTTRDLRWFRRILSRDTRYHIKKFSELFPNRGTERYYRMYVEIERNQRGIQK